MTNEVPGQDPDLAQQPNGRACVLVVDDELFICETLADVLEDVGYYVETARDGAEALDRLDDLGDRTDCVILDIRLAPPTKTDQLDGIGVLGILKERYPDAGVIIITAYASVENAVAALNLGADAYLQKPINPEELLPLVNKTVERRKLVREKARLEAQAQEQNRYLLTKNRELAEANRQLQETLHRLNETQAQLIQSEKLASLGQLVAGVAHELNNPISFVYSNMARLLEYVEHILHVFTRYREALDGLRRGQPPGEEGLQELAELEAATDIDFILKDLQALARESREGAERVQAVVLDLRNFSRVDEGEVQDVDLVSGIESTLALLRPELKHRITLELDLGPLPHIRGNAAQLNQVVMNLLMNAAQAIEGEGTIRLATQPTAAGVRLTVSDTGRGIAPEHLNRIFDPFFTTRRGHQGMAGGVGLGLSIAHAIVQRHAGTIEAESTPGEGTTFTIDLPLAGYRPNRLGAPGPTVRQAHGPEQRRRAGTPPHSPPPTTASGSEEQQDQPHGKEVTP